MLKRWKDGSVITQMPLQPGLEQLYGSPYLLIHRADLHTVLLDKAYAVGVDIKLNSYVSAIHEAEPSVSLGDGTKLGADLVIGADGKSFTCFVSCLNGAKLRSRTGLKSNVRKAVLGGQDVRINFSPSCVYRTLVPASAMKSNPLLRPLIDDPEAIYWLGPSGHIIGYPISNGTMYNFVLCDSSTPPVGLVPETVQLSEIQARFHDWEPVVRQLVDLVTSPLKWQLAEVEEPPSWVSPSGNVAMIGDASHAMVPHLAQGAAMALEDACALAVCVDRARGDAKDLPALMGHFERIRRGRCYHILREAAQLGQMWHLADGPGQMTRDKQMQESSARLNRDWEKQKQAQAWNPNRWDDAEFQPMLFGHDAEQEVR